MTDYHTHSSLWGNNKEREKWCVCYVLVCISVCVRLVLSVIGTNGLCLSVTLISEEGSQWAISTCMRVFVWTLSAWRIVLDKKKSPFFYTIHWRCGIKHKSLAHGHIPVPPCLSVLLSVRQGVQQDVCNLSSVLLCRVLILNHTQKQLSLKTNNTVSCDFKLQMTQGQFQSVNYYIFTAI